MEMNASPKENSVSDTPHESDVIVFTIDKLQRMTIEDDNKTTTDSDVISSENIINSDNQMDNMNEISSSAVKSIEVANLNLSLSSITHNDNIYTSKETQLSEALKAAKSTIIQQNQVINSQARRILELEEIVRNLSSHDNENETSKTCSNETSPANSSISSMGIVNHRDLTRMASRRRLKSPFTIEGMFSADIESISNPSSHRSPEGVTSYFSPIDSERGQPNELLNKQLSPSSDDASTSTPRTLDSDSSHLLRPSLSNLSDAEIIPTNTKAKKLISRLSMSVDERRNEMQLNRSVRKSIPRTSFDHKDGSLPELTSTSGFYRIEGVESVDSADNTSTGHNSSSSTPLTGRRQVRRSGNRKILSDTPTKQLETSDIGQLESISRASSSQGKAPSPRNMQSTDMHHVSLNLNNAVSLRSYSSESFHWDNNSNLHLFIAHDNPRLVDVIAGHIKTTSFSMEVLLESKSLISGKICFMFASLIYSGSYESVDGSNMNDQRGSGWLVCNNIVVVESKIDAFERRVRENNGGIAEINFDSPSIEKRSISTALLLEQLFQNYNSRVDVILDPSHQNSWYPYFDGDRKMAPQFRSKGIGYLRLGDDMSEFGNAFLSVNAGKTYLDNGQMAAKKSTKVPIPPKRKTIVKSRASGHS